LLFYTVALAFILTLVFMSPPEDGAGAEWGFYRRLAATDALCDSVRAVMADTVDVVTATIDLSLWGTLDELGLDGGLNARCSAILQDSLGWGTGQQPGDTVQAVYRHGRLREIRAYPRYLRGFYSIDLDTLCAVSGWRYVPQERWLRLRAASFEVERTVYEAIREFALPEDLTPSGGLATRRDSLRAAGYVVEFQQNLTDRLFAYDIDFYHDVRPGDSVWVLFEETVYPETGEVGFRRILAAKYGFRSGGLVEALPFWHQPDTLLDGGVSLVLDHYHRDGASLRTMFLKMPVPFGRISSPYSSARMHPVLGYTRAHRGVDYAAPTGTEIYAVGDGVITRRGWNGGYGNYVRVRHANGYETEYGHLSGYASGQSVGTYVRQGEVIGYVGSTGLSTGPHVHFGMKRNGSFVNPATEILPPADPLEGEELAEFRRQLPVLEGAWELLAGRELPLPEDASGGEEAG
jgi:murein DD-endopeptidase MepM/ murein hydrolase activator NlpD